MESTKHQLPNVILGLYVDHERNTLVIVENPTDADLETQQKLIACAEYLTNTVVRAHVKIPTTKSETEEDYVVELDLRDPIIVREDLVQAAINTAVTYFGQDLEIEIRRSTPQ